MTTTLNKGLNIPSKTLLSPGHRACAGCGQMIAARAVVDALGPNTIIANATGCLEVVTTPYPESSWGVAWIHSLFENASAVASGIRAALDYKSKFQIPLRPRRSGATSPYKEEECSDIILPLNKGELEGVKVVAQGGDGATFDIGSGLISGMWERGENILYVCYDNEGYMNTGAQASAATPYAAATTTTPSGKAENIYGQGSHFMKKDMLAIALAHGLKYVAQTTAAYPLDIANKVKKAVNTPGPSYIQILVPCIPGWKIEPAQTVRLAKLAAETGIYPVVEFIDGKISSVMKAAQPKVPVEQYLRPQGRFKHLFADERGKQLINFIQKLADENIKKYGLN